MVAIGRWVRMAGAAAALALAAGRAGAQTTWTADLSGPNESPPNSSPGTGRAVVSLTGNILSVDASFAGLVAGTTASHIHCCTAESFAGVAGVATAVPTFPGFPLGVMSGTYSNAFDLSLATTYNPAFITANGGSVEAARTTLLNGMNAGTSYFNIHSTTFPAGEIRGFLVVTPEPATLLLLGTGLAAVGGVVRRTRGSRGG